MSDYKHSCPHCGVPIETDAGKYGRKLSCPSCQGRVEPPELAEASEEGLAKDRDRVTEPGREPIASTPPIIVGLEYPPPPGAFQKECPFCNQPIRATAKKCKYCGGSLEEGWQRDQPGFPICQPCGGDMYELVLAQSAGCGGMVVALLTFAVGVGIFFWIPVAGWVIGPLICAGSLFMGYQRRRVWRCRNCGSVVDRA